LKQCYATCCLADIHSNKNLNCMKKFLLLVIFFLPALIVLAQNRTITGKITNPEGKPVSFATVTIKGTKTSVAADVNGDFSIQAPPNAILVFSAAGFTGSEVNSGNLSTVNVSLGAQAALAEVVVTAMGIRREKKALGYAVSTVDKKLLESRPDGDLGRLLSGKAPGVDILATSGLSGSGTNIQIRGANSITGGSDPLFVVDGTPFNGSTNQQTNLIYGSQTSSRFLDIDPNNIESVNILKGLSATVLYGEAGRNGVIVITTKNGSGRRTNKKAEVSVTQSYFITQPSSLP
jgi:TonB-dependent SusC/RagA subfamily outer membrane receptor